MVATPMMVRAPAEGSGRRGRGSEDRSLARAPGGPLREDRLERSSQAAALQPRPS